MLYNTIGRERTGEIISHRFSSSFAVTQEIDGTADFDFDQSRSTDTCPLTFRDKCFANKPQNGARETLDDGRQYVYTLHIKAHTLDIHVQLDKPLEELFEIGDKVQPCCAISNYEASGEKLSSLYIFIFIERTRRVPLRQAIDARRVRVMPCSLSPSFAVR